MKPRNAESWPNASSEIGTIVTGSQAPVDTRYVGRFAPSPTGPLHFGSLVAAAASYLQARANKGLWLLRVEDIDPPRAQPGAADQILRALEVLRFEWDGPVSYQSASRAQHEAAINRLIEQGYAYPCGCSRRELAGLPASPLGPIYPGTCRDGTRALDTALRVRTDNKPLIFHDLVQGEQCHHLERESGDFVILRKDNLIAYQLAVVVDDHLQGITEVVRGIDLMNSTPRQIWLQDLLGYSIPTYGHIPLAVSADGQKLSKSQGAAPVNCDAAALALFAALEFLNQSPPAELRGAPVETLWQWAIGAWDIHRMQGNTRGFAAANLYQTPKFQQVKKP